MTQSDPQAPEDEQEEKEETFLSHLMELRDRLLRVVIVVMVLFVCLFPFGNKLYTLLAGPLLAQLGGDLISIKPVAPVFVPLKMAMLLAFIIAVPYVLYQLWAFIAPGLYKHEKRLVTPILFSSTILFYLGMVFAYFVVFPLMFKFVVGIAPEGVTVMTDISEYLDFVILIFIAFGIAFEVPIVTVVLVALGMTTPEALGKKRPYVIVGAFVVGMFMTPPDIISQVLLAVPVWLLFEGGLIFARVGLKKKDDDDGEEVEDAEAQEAK